jgi:hypothetical protein
MTLDVRVFHRLALGVEPIDALTGLRAVGGLRVGREVTTRRRTKSLGSTKSLDPLLDSPVVYLETTGGRFKLRHDRGVRDRVTIRIDHPGRRWVGRRFDVELWSRAEVEAADADPPTGAFIPIAARLLRPSLLPGSAWAPPRGATGVRGRVLRGGKPVRWPRVVARDAAGALLGWTHGDDRGEFLLLVTNLGTLPPPAPSGLDIRLTVHVPAQPPAVDPRDPTADLVVEPIAKALTQPAPGTPADDVLTGRAVPAGYQTASAPFPVSVVVGEVLASLDVPFTP